MRSLIGRIILLVLVSILASCGLSVDNDFKVFVSGYDGEVVVLRGDQQLPVVLGMSLKIGDYIKVNADAHVQLLFSKGALLIVNSDSYLLVDDAQVVRLIQGETFYYVEPQQVKGFTVQTDRVNIEVVGTQFLVQHNKNSTLVAVASGLVCISLMDETLILDQGQQLIVDEHQLLEQHAISEEIKLRLNQLWLYLGMCSITQAAALQQENKSFSQLINDLEAQHATLRSELVFLHQQIRQLKNELVQSQRQSSAFQQLYETERAVAERYKQLLQQFSDTLVE